MTLSPATLDRIGSMIGWTPTRWRPVTGGYTAAARYLVSNDQYAAFAKLGATPLSARMLRLEAGNYRRISGSFMPRLLGFDDRHNEPPLLVIEDLSAAKWPPPWSPGEVDAVLAQIRAMHASTAALEPFAAVHGHWASGWQVVADDPAPFLALGLVSAQWLQRALPVLLEAEAACSTDGDAVTHYDLRSDNICIGPDGAKFVDWSEACLGNPRLDLGAWLPSLHFEGGPPPEAMLPDAPEIAAWLAGFFAARAGLPIIPDAPLVRRVQQEQLSTALPWAQRALALEPGA
jgi:hypothetical protein